MPCRRMHVHQKLCFRAGRNLQGELLERCLLCSSLPARWVPDCNKLGQDLPLRPLEGHNLPAGWATQHSIAVPLLPGVVGKTDGVLMAIISVSNMQYRSMRTTDES